MPPATAVSNTRACVPDECHTPACNAAEVSLKSAATLALKGDGQRFPDTANSPGPGHPRGTSDPAPTSSHAACLPTSPRRQPRPREDAAQGGRALRAFPWGRRRGGGTHRAQRGSSDGPEPQTRALAGGSRAAPSVWAGGGKEGRRHEPHGGFGEDPGTDAGAVRGAAQPPAGRNPAAARTRARRRSHPANPRGYGAPGHPIGRC